MTSGDETSWTLGEVTLAGYDTGPHASGRTPIVLVHGYTGSADDWHHVAPGLAVDRRVVRVSQRGHGASSRVPAAGYSFDALVADLVALLGHLDLGPVHLLGHSMGGCVSLRTALDHGVLLASLVLMDTAADPAGEIPLEMIEGVAEIGRAQGMQAVADLVGPLFAAAQPEGATPRPKRPGGDGESLAQMDVEAFSRFAAELNAYGPYSQRLGELALPTTVLVGENDHGLRAAADAFEAGITGATKVVIADAGHSPQDDQPEAWLAAVRAHLARAEA